MAPALVSRSGPVRGRGCRANTLRVFGRGSMAKKDAERHVAGAESKASALTRTALARDVLRPGP